MRTEKCCKCRNGGGTSYLSPLKTALKRGFTIMELVIVIAVIAVLAAVLIPTFANITDRANESAEEQTVKNLNTILSSEEVLGNRALTMSQAIDIAAAGGYNVSAFTPTDGENDILWNQTTNSFVLAGPDGDIIYSDGSVSGKAGNTFWKIYNTEAEITADKEDGANKYSIYLADNFAISGILSVTSGVDVGNNVDISISYSDNQPETVIFNTNDGSLTVNNANATVNHYGTIATATITAVDSSDCYTEYGTVTERLTIHAGKLVIPSGVTVPALYVTSNNVTVENGGAIENYYPSENVTVEPEGNAPAVTTETKSITSLSQIEGSGYYILTQDSTLSKPFVLKTGKVTIDFNNHIVTTGTKAPSNYVGISAGAELTLLDNSTDGNGGIIYKGGGAAYALINAQGNVYIYGGNYISNSSGSCVVSIYNTSESVVSGGKYKSDGFGTVIYVDGKLELNDGLVETADSSVVDKQNAIVVSEKGEVEINGGQIKSIYGNALDNDGRVIINNGYFYSEHRGSAGYCIQSQSYIEIHGGEVHGIQGGIAINGGSAVITDCDVWVEDVVYARGEDTTNKAYYALYVAGESDKTHSVIISGGTYRSSGAAVVLVGNDTQSGGIREEAYCSIYGGTFLSLDTISVNDKPSGKTTQIFSGSGATLGTAVIYGGTYNKDISVYSFLDIVKAPVNNGDGTWTVNSGISAPVN